MGLIAPFYKENIMTYHITSIKLDKLIDEHQTVYGNYLRVQKEVISLYKQIKDMEYDYPYDYDKEDLLQKALRPLVAELQALAEADGIIGNKMDTERGVLYDKQYGTK